MAIGGGISLALFYPGHKRRVQAADAQSPYSRTGGVSDRLLLTLNFEPKSQFFHIHLKNNWPGDLVLLLDPAKYYGTILIAREGEEPKEYYSKDMIARLREPFLDNGYKLPKDGVVTWDVPITDLRDASDHPVSLQRVLGCVASARLDQVAIVPPRSIFPPRGHIFQTSNAIQKSPGIKIESP